MILKQERVAPKAHSTETIIQKATLSAAGKKQTTCNVCGKVIKTESIDIAKTVQLSASKFVFDGAEKTPAVIVKNSKGYTIDVSNYTVIYPNERINVGKYIVKIVFKGDYSGTKNLTFTVNPPKTSIAKLTGKRNSFAVKWSKKTTQVTGYEIQYSTSGNFKKGNTTVIIKKAKTTSTTVKKLKGAKKYYVRIRTYKTLDGNKYFSDWSAKKVIKTKK